MCGIVGSVSYKPVLPVLLEGLRKLEYRGYDSAGVAVLDGEQFERTRSVGKIAALESELAKKPEPKGCTGIAHTRWATHGAPTESNAHPHMTGDKLALVHNGIIENHQPLRAVLMSEGVRFESETDTEVIIKLIEKALNTGLSTYDALLHTVDQLEGAYALALINKSEPKKLYGARSGSPLVVGIGEKEAHLASDMSALIRYTQDFYVLEDGDIVEINDGEIRLSSTDGETIQRPKYHSNLSASATDLGEYRHYMHKEIHEQKQAVIDTLEGRLGGEALLDGIFGPEQDSIFSQTEQVQILACGTSYHAGMVARYWLEKFNIPCQVEIASEFRSRRHAVRDNTLVVSLSQSGETLDTIEALKHAKRLGFAYSLAICNAPESSLVRESDLVLMTHAGPEIGVASTKAFTTQLTALLLFTVALGTYFNCDKEQRRKIIAELRELPSAIGAALKQEDAIAELAAGFANKNHALFLGRGSQYPIAMEGALKLKEISYIHAEAYAAGELKHGPLALVDERMPVIAVAPNNRLIEKLKSNIEEVKARGGHMIIFADTAAEVIQSEQCQVINIASVDNIIAPIVYSIPLQLLAYHVALVKGTDVDKPRNLAKSVTVE